MNSFHPACMRQAANAKSAVCKHVQQDDDHNLQIEDVFQAEIEDLKKHLQEVKKKYHQLQQEHEKLKVKVEKIEKKIQETKWGQSPTTTEKAKTAGKPATVHPSDSNHLKLDAGTRTPNQPKQSQVTIQLKAKGHQDNGPLSDKRVDPGTSNQTRHEAPRSTVQKSPSSKKREEETLTDEIRQTSSFPENEDKFIFPRRNKRKGKPTPNTRPEPLKGTNEEVPLLKAAQRTACLFVTGLAPEMESENIISYLESKNLAKGCQCEKMITLNSKIRSSFKMTVPLNDRDAYMSPELWPRGISINHFLNLQNRQTVINQIRCQQHRKTENQ